jgi:hypothetical protein
MRRYRFIVARDNERLYEHLVRSLAALEEIEVILDRRVARRRGGGSSPGRGRPSAACRPGWTRGSAATAGRSSRSNGRRPGATAPGFSVTIGSNRPPRQRRPNPGEETARMTPPITVYTNVG